MNNANFPKDQSLSEKRTAEKKRYARLEKKYKLLAIGIYTLIIIITISLMLIVFNLLIK